MTRKSTSKISKLPLTVRDRINRDLLVSKSYADIAGWLLEEKLVEGDSHAIEMQLHRWFKSGFQAWRREEIERDSLVRLVENIEAQMSAAGGMDIVARSLLLEQMTVIRSSASSPEEKAAAFVQINRQLEAQKQGNREDRKLKLLEEREAKSREIVSNEHLTAEEKEVEMKRILGVAA